MPSADVLDIIVRLQNLAQVRAGLTSVAAGVREVGKAGNSTSRNIAGMQRNSKALTATLKVLKIAAVGVAAGLALAAADGAKMAIRYDAAIERLHTQAGLSQRWIPILNKQVLELASSGKYAQGPQELADGLYHLVSVGMKAPQALNALKIAAQGAAVGNANLEDTTTALASAWLTNIKGAGNFAHVMALANATVGAGNMRMEDLVLSLGTGVLPASKAAGLGIQDVFSALAVLSDEGWKGSSAMAQFSTALHFLTNPTQKAQKALAAIGLTQTDIARKMRGPEGLHAGLQLLHDKLNAFSRDPVIQQEIMGSILPGGRGRVMMVLLNQLDRLDMKYRQINRTTSQYGDDVRKTHETASFKIHAAWSMIQADMIKLGHVVAPLIVVAVQGFAAMVGWLSRIPQHIRDVIHWWNGLPEPVRIMGVYLGVLTGLVVAYIAASKGIKLVTILWSMMSSAIETARIAMLMLMDNPLLLFLAAVTAGLITLYIEWKPFREIIKGIVDIGRIFLHFLNDTLGKLGPAGPIIKAFFMAWLTWKAVGFLSMIRGLVGAKAAMTAAARMAGVEAGAVTAAASAEETGALVGGEFAARAGMFSRVGRFLGRAIGMAAGPVLAALLAYAAYQVIQQIKTGLGNVLSGPTDANVAELSDPTLQHDEAVLRRRNTPHNIARNRRFMSAHPDLNRMNNRLLELTTEPMSYLQHESPSARRRREREIASLRRALHKGHFPGYGFGGINHAGGLSLVGERGPEIVELPGGARVTPLETSTSNRLQPIPLTAGVTGTTPGGQNGEGGTYILQVHLDKRVLAEAVFDHAQQKAARK